MIQWYKLVRTDTHTQPHALTHTHITHTHTLTRTNTHTHTNILTHTHTQTHTHTHTNILTHQYKHTDCRFCLKLWLNCRTYMYLTTHNTHRNTRICLLLVSNLQYLYLFLINFVGKYFLFDILTINTKGTFQPPSGQCPGKDCMTVSRTYIGLVAIRSRYYMQVKYHNVHH